MKCTFHCLKRPFHALKCTFHSMKWRFCCVAERTSCCSSANFLVLFCELLAAFLQTSCGSSANFLLLLCNLLAAFFKQQSGRRRLVWSAFVPIFMLCWREGRRLIANPPSVGVGFWACAARRRTAVAAVASCAYVERFLVSAAGKGGAEEGGLQGEGLGGWGCIGFLVHWSLDSLRYENCVCWR